MATWVPINTQTIGSGITSVVFNSFSGYTDLIFILSASPANAGNSIYARFNNDAGTYAWIQLLPATTPSSNTGTGTYMKIVNNLDTSSVVYDASQIWIPNYSNASYFKQVLSYSGGVNSGPVWTSAAWANTNAITSITFTDESGGSLGSGSTFTLFGILAA